MGTEYQYGVRLGRGTDVLMYVEINYTSSPVYHETDSFEVQGLLPPGKLTIILCRLMQKHIFRTMHVSLHVIGLYCVVK
jgi:hypothetical protein